MEKTYNIRQRHPSQLSIPSVGVRIFTTHFPHKKEGASYLLPKVPGTIMKKCYQK